MGTRLQPIEIRGQYLWQSDHRFYVRGVVYQLPRLIGDPISDDHFEGLIQDVALFRELGINTIYVYRIDNTKSHEKAMKMLDEAGIYVIASLFAPPYYINSLKPYDSYKPELLEHCFKTLYLLSRFPNVVGVVAADQIVRDEKSTAACPVIKAVIQDLKRYMNLQHELRQQRMLPVAYDAMTGGPLDILFLNYLKNDSPEFTIDFWMCKYYLAKPGSGLLSSSPLTEDDDMRFSARVGIPALFSEYSDNTVKPRHWKGLPSLYSPPVSDFLSGVCIYQFHELANGYGLVGTLRNDTNKQGAACRNTVVHMEDASKTLELREIEHGRQLIYRDFENLKVQLGDISEVIDNEQAEGVAREPITETVDIGTTEWPWEREYQQPATCVDWVEVEKGIRARV